MALLVFITIFAACSGRPAKYKDAPLKNGRVVISISEVTDRKVHFYSYSGGDRRINFFVRADGKGTVSAYFDACYTCYRAKKGYRQEGPDIICNECSLKFGLAEEKWDEKNGCNPIPLKSVIENDSLIIDTEVLKKGGKLF